MKNYAIIPARFASSRFPGKPLALISGKPMIQRVYERVKQVELIDNVFVATDDHRIAKCVMEFGGQVLMTSSLHTCGTDRVSECIDILHLEEDDLVLNIQGDEPLIDPRMIIELVNVFEDESVYMATLKKRIESEEEKNDPNIVKVVTDYNDDAIYFSRYCIPFERDEKKVNHFKHVGIYGYKSWFLKKYSKMEKSNLEVSESLEQLRVIENGMKIRVKETQYKTIGVDTKEHIKLVESLIGE